MKTVGIRELKNRLSEYLRQVRSGESLLEQTGAKS
jgi:prevent-host-death family protein